MTQLRPWPLVIALAACGGGTDVDAEIFRGTGSAGTGGGAGAADDLATRPSADFDNATLGGPVPMGEFDPNAREVCADVVTTPDRLVPTVSFLVDGSSSMTCVYPEESGCRCEDQLLGNCTATGSESRWQALERALFETGAGSAEGPVAALERIVRFGMVVYNNGVDADNMACPNLPVEIGGELENYAALASAFPSVPPGVNTPTGPALQALVASLPDADARRADGLGPDSIVLATDGQPFTCVDPVSLERALDYESVLAAARAAADKGIDVHVVSLAPASGDFAAHLDEVATLGGTGEAHVPADRDALTDRLKRIVTDQISCEVELRGAVRSGSECEGEVRLNGESLSCGGANGWRLLDEAHIELVGDACRTFKEDPQAELEASFPCGVFTLG